MQFGQKSLKLLTLIRQNNGAKLRKFGVKATTCKAKARDLTVEAKGLIPEANVGYTVKITSVKNWNWHSQTNTKLLFLILFFLSEVKG